MARGQDGVRAECEVSVLVAADEHGLRRGIVGTAGAVSLMDALLCAERRSADESGSAMAVSA